eukprot:4716700-Pyramimonas_sp.AAC.1
MSRRKTVRKRTSTNSSRSSSSNWNGRSGRNRTRGRRRRGNEGCDNNKGKDSEPPRTAEWGPPRARLTLVEAATSREASVCGS